MLPSETNVHGRTAGPTPERVAPAGSVAVAALVALALVGVLCERVAAGSLRPFAPAMLVATSFADVATGLVLLTIWRPFPTERVRFVVALGFLVSGAIVFCACMALQLWPWDSELEPPMAAASPWLFTFWHVGTAATAIIYATMRTRPSPRSFDFDAGVATSERRFVRVSIGIALGYLVVAIGASVALVVLFPHLLSHDTFDGTRSTTMGALVSVLVAYAAYRVAHLRSMTAFDRVYAISLACVATGTSLVTLSSGRFDLSWYIARLLFCASSALVFAFALRQLVRSRSTLLDTEVELLRSAGESVRRADRIRALRRIATADNAPADEHIRTLLQTAAATLRAGTPTCAVLAHADDATIYVDEVAWSGASQAESTSVFPGAQIPRERTIFSNEAATACTRSWNDLSGLSAESMVCHEEGWRSLIFAPVEIGRRTYLLVFGFLEPMIDEALCDQDEAYVEVLAAFIAHRFTERQQRERLQFQIEHDPLTGLHNRTQLRTMLRRSVAQGDPLALGIIDIADFRGINTKLGQMIADELLVEVAVALAGIDDRDFIARLGADKFAIVLIGVPSSDDARRRLARYLEVFERPFHTGDRDGTRMVNVSAALGAAMFPIDGMTADELMCSADVALDVAKEQCRPAVVLFDRGMSERLEHVFIKSVELNEAIENDGLQLVYQPTFDIVTRRITGAEALVRWNHPSLGQLPPSEFIAFAERNGLIGRLSLWVMHRVIADLRAMTAVPSDFRCFFNLATPQLDDMTFIADLESQLRATPALAPQLGIEITETAAIHNIESSMYALSRFRKLGLQIAIDDFGTGYSSLSYLKRLPVDVIKIDRSFIDGIPTDAKDIALCELLLQAAARFELKALAEGIETEEQLAWLRDAGCHSGQGFLISRPVTFDVLTAKLLRPDCIAPYL